FAATLVTLVLLIRWMRRAVRVGDYADADRQASLAIGNTVPLERFAPGAPGVLRRGWFGYQIVADGQPVYVSGRLIRSGARGRYRLGEEIGAGERSFAVFRTDTARPSMDVSDLSLGFSGEQLGGVLR